MTSFLELHRPGRPLLMPNPWDAGSAKVLESLGFEALATTSSGYAATLGRRDYGLTRDEALAHARVIVEAVDVPVSGDLENGFGPSGEDCAATVRGAREAGLAGCSIEDFSGDEANPIFERAAAVERVRAAVEAAGDGFVLTARCESWLWGNEDIGFVVDRLQAYAEAGAHVLYAPGLTRASDIRAVVEAVDKPVNVLAFPGAPEVAELAELGVARVSVGGAFAWAAMAGLVAAATELREQGTYGYFVQVATGARAAKRAFS